MGGDGGGCVQDERLPESEDQVADDEQREGDIDEADQEHACQVETDSDDITHFKAVPVDEVIDGDVCS